MFLVARVSTEKNLHGFGVKLLIEGKLKAGRVFINYQGTYHCY